MWSKGYHRKNIWLNTVKSVARTVTRQDVFNPIFSPKIIPISWIFDEYERLLINSYHKYFTIFVPAGVVSETQPLAFGSRLYIRCNTTTHIVRYGTVRYGKLNNETTYRPNAKKSISCMFSWN